MVEKIPPKSPNINIIRINSNKPLMTHHPFPYIYKFLYEINTVGDNIFYPLISYLYVEFCQI